MATGQTISAYLIQQLYAHGVRHVFGVPGDYVLNFYGELERSPLRVINTCDEQGAGFAADAYARVGGLGVVCITYGVGGLKVVNTTAQAFAEKSPVVIISGTPGTQERGKNPLLHHKVRKLGTGKGFDIHTEEQLEEALHTSRQHTQSFCILDVHLDPHDSSPALQRLTRMLAKRMKSNP